MKIFRSVEEVQINSPTAVTVGTFDGVHIGHQHVLQALKNTARECNCEDVLITFDPHPQMVVEPKKGIQIQLLTTLEEKLNILAKYDISSIFVIPFTREFSQMSYKDFIQKILVERLGVKVMVIGYDHAFGRNREGHYQQLQETAQKWGFQVRVVEPFLLDGEPISSTRIRKSLFNGDVERTAELLGRPYMVQGRVVPGSKRGVNLGFPTANLEVPDPNKLIPKPGVYAVDVTVRGQFYSGMMNIGHRPTFNHDPLTLEVHIFKFFSSIYHETIEVWFKKFIREEIKFRSPEELRQQLLKDKEICMNL
ncbi:MAG: bifunctional riboflavin kinase/FAD synthetase [Calditrichia bacterium]